MATKKETVIEELFSILSGANFVDLVSREFLTIEEVPAKAKKVIVMEDEGPEDDIRYTSSDFADVDFTVSLWCYIETNENLSTEMNEFDRKIKALLGSNRKLNDKAYSSQILPLTEKSGTELNPWGYFVRPLRIQYEGSVLDGL